jgi:uncharacterized 2Fe-2S/4Fe-4S cluster protein (DUF4445 family)
MVEKAQIEVDSVDVEITFQPSGRSGLMPVGTYLSDAANRLGIFFEPGCEPGGDRTGHCCAVTVLQGAEHLSVPTQQELDNLSDEARVKGERLACQARIENEGEFIIEMIETEEAKSEKAVKEEQFEAYQKEFSDLPLTGKVGQLMQLEAITLGETFSFVLNLPFTIGDQIMGVMAGFGKEMDKAAREAKHPQEHNENGADEGETAGEAEDEKTVAQSVNETSAVGE